MQGGWVLVRMRRDDGGRAQWLLIKHRDDFADPEFDVTSEVTTSVATGRTMEEIASRSRRVWRSNREPADTPNRTPAARRNVRRAPTRKPATARRGSKAR
jgi:bifunctional non-homologous end joining protein LigD